MKKTIHLTGMLLLCFLLCFSALVCFAEEAAVSPDNVILFTQNGVECVAENVITDGTNVTISGNGEYIIRGECDNAQIRVLTAEKNNPVTLVFDNATLRGSQGPVLYAECKKLTIATSEGSKNYLGDAPSREAPKNDDPDACVYCANHLTITGTGSLTVNALIGRGIQCKDTLTIESGNLSVTSAVKDAVRANDGISMHGGDVTLKSPKNGFETTKVNDGKGNILLEGGTLTVTSGKIPFNAAGMTHINGCNIVLWENEED